jgi:hypothetical protein
MTSGILRRAVTHGGAGENRSPELRLIMTSGEKKCHRMRSICGRVSGCNELVGQTFPQTVLELQRIGGLGHFIFADDAVPRGTSSCSLVGLYGFVRVVCAVMFVRIRAAAQGNERFRECPGGLARVPDLREENIGQSRGAIGARLF